MQPARPVEFFGTIPSALESSFTLGSFNIHWGVVSSFQGKAIQPTLVAVWRNKGASVSVGYVATALNYLRDIVMNRLDVQQVNAGKVLRLPESEEEFQSLLQELAKTVPYQSANIGAQIGEAGSNARV